MLTCLGLSLATATGAAGAAGAAGTVLTGSWKLYLILREAFKCIIFSYWKHGIETVICIGDPVFEVKAFKIK